MAAANVPLHCGKLLDLPLVETVDGMRRFIPKKKANIECQTQGSLLSLLISFVWPDLLIAIYPERNSRNITYHAPYGPWWK